MTLFCKNCRRGLDAKPEPAEGDWVIRCFYCGAKNIVIAILEVVGWRQ